MKTRTKRIVAAVALTGAALAVSATAAWARTGNGPETIQNSYVKFDGNIYWEPTNGTNHGGMDVYGTLYNSAGGNYAKIQGKVSGYGYTTLWTTDSSKNGFYNNKIVYDPQALYVTTGTVNVCHINNYSADNCSSEYNTRY
jgi:hypothetical protein